MYIELDSEQQRAQSARETLEAIGTAHNQSLTRRTEAVRGYWDSETRLQMMRLVGLAQFGFDIADLPDREPQTTRTSPVILPMKWTRSLIRREQLR